jgi:hypothetical protein
LNLIKEVTCLIRPLSPCPRFAWTGLTAYDYENKYDLPEIAVKLKKKMLASNKNF